MLTEREESLCSVIRETAIKIHQQTGPGLYESAYVSLLVYELNKIGIKTEIQKEIPAVYKGHRLDLELKADLVVGDLIVCEIESEEKEDPTWKARLLTHLKFSGLEVGFVLNFMVVDMEEGIRKYILSESQSMV